MSDIDQGLAYQNGWIDGQRASAARIESLTAALEKADALADAARLMLHRGVIWHDEVEREFQAPLKTYQDAVDTLSAYSAARDAVK